MVARESKNVSIVEKFGCHKRAERLILRRTLGVRLRCMSPTSRIDLSKFFLKLMSKSATGNQFLTGEFQNACGDLCRAGRLLKGFWPVKGA
jgi:hypothetical protein